MALLRSFAVAAFGVVFVLPATAQTSYYDFSKPMAGKSKYVFNQDGTPVELGVRETPKPLPKEPTPAPVGWAGTVGIQEPQAEPAANASQAANRERSGRSTLIVTGRKRQTEEKKATPRRSATIRVGGRRRR